MRPHKLELKLSSQHLGNDSLSMVNNGKAMLGFQHENGIDPANDWLYAGAISSFDVFAGQIFEKLAHLFIAVSSASGGATKRSLEQKISPCTPVNRIPTLFIYLLIPFRLTS
jgi:hypothetical protein